MSRDQVLILMTLVPTVITQCSIDYWFLSVDTVGQSACNESDRYIRGLKRTTNVGSNDRLYRLVGAECCSAPPQWTNTDIHVLYTNWYSDLDKKYIWAYCPSGYFLQGLYRSNKNYLSHVEGARCARPSNHPLYYGECYQEDVSVCLNNEGTCSCRESFYIAGLYKSSCNYLNCLDTLMCCKLAEKPPLVDEVSKVKTRIMDTTLWSMANLAHMLGYGWCLGCRALHAGEDFYRDGDRWVADPRSFHPNRKCKGLKSDERLIIEYNDWIFAVKDIVYGQIVFDNLQAESIDSGTIYNMDATPVTDTFDVSETVQDTITHSTSSSWKNSKEFQFSIQLEIPFTGKSTYSYKTAYEESSSKSNESSDMKSKTFTKSIQKTLQPFSAAKYNVILSKTRTTIPYTAIIIAKFSTVFKGFLRWDGGYASPSTNYHYQYKGNASRPTFNYRFGGNAETFYTALKRESEGQSLPWLWNDLMRNYPQSRDIIDRLTDESQYEFTLSGKLEHVAGTNINVAWEAVNITRREVQDGKGQGLKETHFAMVGSKDKPAIVQYPKMNLGSTKPYRPQTIFVSENSNK